MLFGRFKDDLVCGEKCVFTDENDPFGILGPEPDTCDECKYNWGLRHSGEFSGSYVPMELDDDFLPF